MYLNLVAANQLIATFIDSTYNQPSYRIHNMLKMLNNWLKKRH